MRFRAFIDQVPTFCRIVQSIEKLSKKCIVRFSEVNMQIICPGENEDGVQVWSTIKVDSLFSEYRIQSNANNEINAQLATEPLWHALKDASSSAEVVMKLAKKDDQAVFAFEIQQMSQQGKKMQVTHNVKVQILRPNDMQSLKEPMCPEPDVHVVAPPLAKLRTVVERLKHFSDVIRFSVNHSGQLMLAARTDDARVESQWNNLVHPNIESGESSQPSQEKEEVDPQHHFGALVSAQSLLKFLNSHVVSSTTIACVCENHCLIMYVYIGDINDAGGILTFYIPARLEGDD